MHPNGHHQSHHQPALALHSQFAGTPQEGTVRDLLRLGASLAGVWLALMLQDETGTWYRQGSDPMGEPMRDLVSVLGLRGGPAFQLMETHTLMDEGHRSIGTLTAWSPTPRAISEAQGRGLRLLASHIQDLVVMDGSGPACPGAPRPSDGEALVPGLVHELGGFTFGISASLDAFEARFSGLHEARKYGANIRKSLDWMGSLIEELREFGYPQQPHWSVIDLEPLLISAIAEHRPTAERQQVDLRLAVEGNLPLVSANEMGLRSVFMRMLDLALQHQEPGGRVDLRVVPIRSDGFTRISGCLDFYSPRFWEVDLNRLFEPFYFRNSGLGRLRLPGARRVLEILGGSLSAGPGPDGGTRIRFVLPTNLPRPGHPVLRPSASGVGFGEGVVQGGKRPVDQTQGLIRG